MGGREGGRAGVVLGDKIRSGAGKDMLRKTKVHPIKKLTFKDPYDLYVLITVIHFDLRS